MSEPHWFPISDFDWEEWLASPDDVLDDLPPDGAAPTAPRRSSRGPEAVDQPEIPVGSRNNALTSLAGSMRHRGMGEEAIAAALLVVNRERCKPPLPEVEVRAVAGSVMRYVPGTPAPGGNTVNTVDSVSGGDWEEPVPLQLDIPDLPRFPVDSLTPILRDYVLAVSEEAQVAPEIVAPFALAAVSLAVCARFAVEPWEGWIEDIILWVGVAAPPGARKSKAERRTVGVIYTIEEQLRLEKGPDVARAVARKNVLRKALDEAIKNAARKPKDEGLMRAAELASVDFEQASIPPLPRLVTSNATPEALAKTLSECDGRLLVSSSEGGEVIAIAAGLYSQGKDAFDILLKGWSGDPISIDRKTTGRVYVPHPCLPMALMFQPAVLLEMGARKSFRGRGLLGRFLFAISKSNVGYRRAQGMPLPDAVRMRYATLIENLLRIPDKRDEFDRPEPIILKFDTGAAAKTKEYFDRMEAAQRDGEALEHFRDWASKAHGHLVRIAGALHMAEHHEHRDPASLQVPETTIRNAIAIMDFFLPHSQAAFSLMVEKPERARAARVLRHLQEKEVETTTKRDIHRALPAVFEEATDIDKPLEILERHGFVRVVEATRRPGPGRDPSPTVRINPLWLRQNRQNRQNPPGAPPRRDSVETVNSVRGSPGEGGAPAADSVGPESSGGPEGPPIDQSDDRGVVRF